MEILQGIAASPGYAIGKAIVFEREDVPVRKGFVPENQVEVDSKTLTEISASARLGNR